MDPQDGPICKTLARRFDRLDQGVLSSDLEGRLVYFNPFFSRMVGLEPEPLVGRGFPYPWWPENEAAWRSSLLAGMVRLTPAIVQWVGPFTFPTSIVGAEGSPLRVSVTVDVLVDKTGEALGVVSYFADPGPVLGLPGVATEESEPMARIGGALQRFLAELQAAGVGGKDTGSPGSEEIALDSLSKREREVLRVFLQGDGVATIAERFSISAYTVRNHLKSIYRKLGVHSQRELLMLLRGKS